MTNYRIRNYHKTKHTPVNPYSYSLLRKKLLQQKTLGQKLRIAFLDLDSTMTGDPALTNKTRAILEKAGYAVVFVTTRTEELVMAKTAYDISVQSYGFDRPHPHIGISDNKKRTYLAPEDQEPWGLLNPDVIAGSTGTQILIRQLDGGYMVDKAYEQTFDQTSRAWRTQTKKLLTFADPKHTCATVSPIDDANNYFHRTTDVYPPKYRIQLFCNSLQNKKALYKRFHELKHSMTTPLSIRKQLINVRITDDSHPKQNEYAVYLTPKNGSKTHAVERIVAMICHAVKVKRSELELLIAGDSFPDLQMGLYGGNGTSSTFLLVGGSRLTDVVIKQDLLDFAGETLVDMKQQMTIVEEEGHYQFHAPLSLKRDMIIGDKAYYGKKAVESIFSFLTKHPTTLIEPHI